MTLLVLLEFVSRTSSIAAAVDTRIGPSVLNIVEVTVNVTLPKVSFTVAGLS